MKYHFKHLYKRENIFSKTEIITELKIRISSLQRALKIKRTIFSRRVIEFQTKSVVKFVKYRNEKVHLPFHPLCAEKKP